MTLIRSVLRSPIVVLLTLPAGIAFGIGVLPIGMVFLERNLSQGALSPFVLQFGADSARSLLTVVAAAAMTALSLTYSLVLVVFTLAAANIGPRLLKRFTSEPVNQITAGIFGGTFLYSLTALLFVQPDFVPKVTIAGSGALAILSVFQLIYFIRNVSRSVTIDDEIAAITERLSDALEQHVEQAKDRSDDVEDNHDYVGILKATESGYIGEVDESSLVDLCREVDMIIRFQTPPGRFILGGEELVASTRDLTDEDMAARLRSHIAIEPSRSENRPIEFSVNLLVEIALRALSPGVNDSFTAVAAIDRLFSVFAKTAGGVDQPLRYCDDEGVLRLTMPGISIKSLIGQAFDPLRRASADNILVAQSLARALSRLNSVGSDDLTEVLAKHASLLVDELRKANHLRHDIDSVLECFGPELKPKEANVK